MEKAKVEKSEAEDAALKEKAVTYT